MQSEFTDTFNMSKTLAQGRLSTRNFVLWLGGRILEGENNTRVLYVVMNMFRAGTVGCRVPVPCPYTQCALSVNARKRNMHHFFSTPQHNNDDRN